MLTLGSYWSCDALLLLASHTEEIIYWVLPITSLSGSLPTTRGIRNSVPRVGTLEVRFIGENGKQKGATVAHGRLCATVTPMRFNIYQFISSMEALANWTFYGRDRLGASRTQHSNASNIFLNDPGDWLRSKGGHGNIRLRRSGLWDLVFKNHF